MAELTDMASRDGDVIPRSGKWGKKGLVSDGSAAAS